MENLHAVSDNFLLLENINLQTNLSLGLKILFWNGNKIVSKSKNVIDIQMSPFLMINNLLVTHCTNSVNA